MNDTMIPFSVVGDESIGSQMQRFVAEANDRSIVQFPDPILRRVHPPITQFDDTLSGFARAMVRIMKHHDGLGLAAPQVGVGVRLFVIDTELPPDDAEHHTVDVSGVLEATIRDLLGIQLPHMPCAVVNPLIAVADPTPVEAHEGCLSIQGISAPIVRSAAIHLTYQDLRGNTHVVQLEGLAARCVQHEVDHLDGVLFWDRLSRLRRRRLMQEFSQPDDPSGSGA